MLELQNKGFDGMLEKVVVVPFDILFWHLQDEMRKLKKCREA
jgi:hypothetical protein